MSPVVSLCSCHLLWADELKEKRAIVLGWGTKGRKVLPLLFWGVCLMSLARFQPGEDQTSQLPAVTQNFMSLSPQCAAAEKWPTSSVKEWIGSCLCASKSFCTGLRMWYPGVSVFFGLVRSRRWRLLRAALLARWCFYWRAKTGKMVVTTT